MSYSLEDGDTAKGSEKKAFQRRINTDAQSSGQGLHMQR